ncbi:substrate-binding domain-containing protein [Streptomyces diastatochromogenes]|nr:substrate-binding domain-containing protein [Streptomyces diastatochromogenes]
MVVADPVADDPVVESLLAAGIPVFTDRSAEGLPGAYWVDVDAGGAVREALDHLLEQGARRPVLVVPDSDTRFHAGVFAAHREWCAAHGLPERAVRVAEAGNGPVVRAVETALTADGPERPDALLVVAEASPPSSWRRRAASGTRSRTTCSSSWSARTRRPCTPSRP